MTKNSYEIRSPWPRRILLGTGVALTLAVGVWYFRRGSAEQEDLSSRISSIVEQAMESEGIAGISIGVARGGQTIHAAGYGYADLENQLPASPETVYRVGSITKQFTAASILQLAREGRLALHDPVADHLPYGPEFAPGVTVHSLLNHTSGIPNYTTLERWWRTMGLEMSPTEMVEVFRHEPLDFTAGTDFSYSNSGYFLLGLVIERTANQPYGGYLNEHLAVPLDLPSTSYCDDRALVPNRARGYQLIDDAFYHPPFVSMSQAYSAGGLCTNVIDLLQWTRFLSEGAVLGRQEYQLMANEGILDDGRTVEYGYGLALGYLDGRRKISHVGGILGFSSFMAHYPEDDLRIVVLSNTEGARTAGIESAIARHLLDLEEEASQDILLSPEELALYTGTYDLNLAEVFVSASDGRLVAEITVPGLEGRYELLYQGEHTFQVRSDAQTSASFEISGGVADGFTLRHQGITMRGRRIEPERVLTEL